MKKRIISMIALVCAFTILFGTLNVFAVVYDKTGYPNTYTNTGDYATDLVNVALTQVGYCENPSAADYTKYSYWYFGEDTSYAWCGIFVSWCADQAGIPTDIIHKNKHVYSTSYETYAEQTASGDYFGGTPYNFGSKDPVPGDLFFSTTESGTNTSTHVGIIWKVDSNYIYTIEGNTHFKNSSGQWVGYVQKRMYNRKTGYQYYSSSNTTSSYVHILFYVHPDYEQASVTTPDETDTRISFTDVSKDQYYYDAVVWAVENNITSGTTSTTFSPDAACTRAQAACFMNNLLNTSNEKIECEKFSDVPKSAYYYYPVNWCYKTGITAGTSSFTFSPDETITRAQFVSFLYRYIGSPTTAVDGRFSDVAGESYYSKAIYWAVANGITYGTSSTTFSPKNTCTRAQVVTFLYRFANSYNLG